VRPFAAAVALAIGVAGCAKTLPEQDRRILEATPAAKLSTDDIWKDYQQNRADADARYWGRAVEVSGKVLSVVKDRKELLFGEAADSPHVRASLLDDQAEAILGTAAEGQRIRLKCFCAGVDQVVILKSCVKP
jgi:hypothetical protein